MNSFEIFSVVSFMALLIVALLQRNVINDQKRILNLYKQRNAFLNENIVVVKKQSK